MFYRWAPAPDRALRAPARTVVYVCADARVAGGVERAARRVGLSDRRLRIWMLDDFQRQTRELVTGPTCEPVRDIQGATG